MGSIVPRKTSKGELRYTAYVRRKGHASRTKTFTSKTKARSWIRRVEAAIEERRDLPHREALRRTVAGEVEAYLEDEGFAKLSATEQVKRAAQLRHWCELLGEIKVAELTPAAIRDARRRLMEEGSRGRDIMPSTANRYLAALSRFCTWLIGEGLLAENPARAVKVERGPETRRERILTAEERSRLLEACEAEDPRLHALVVLALTTGGRQGELLGLKWSEIDLDTGRVQFLRTKNGLPRSVPLPAVAVEVLKPFQKVRHIDGTVFGAEPFPEQPWRRARRAAKLQDVRFHDLRHCYATALAEAGATLSELRSALGHKTLSMVLRYQHLTERAVENAIRERLAGVELV